MRNKIIIFLLALLSLPAFSQKEPDKKELFNDGMFFYDRKDYKEAVYHFRKLYRMDKENASIAFKIGDCYMNIHGQETKAIRYLEEAVNDITEEYNEFSMAETKAPLHAYFYLGKAYRMDNQTDKAIEAFYKFTKTPHFSHIYNMEMVEREIDICKHAKILQDKPVKIKMINMGEGINDENANYYPVVSGDEKTMVYVTSLKFYDAINFVKYFNDQWEKPENITPQLYFSKDKWTEPDNVTPEIGSDGNMYPSSLSYDGTELYLVKKARNGSDIYVSTFIEGRWSMAKALGKEINEKRYNETHASLSHDGQVLYFTSDRRGGYGKLDIYRAKRQPDGSWDEVENMGSTINSEKNEDYPFITNNGNTLFFSSEAHYNMGEHDIFYSLKDEKGTWKTPKNIGYPINTTRDDVFYLPVKGGKYGYMAMIDRDGFGNDDIFKIELMFEPFKEAKPDMFPDSFVSFKIIDKNTRDSLIFKYNYKTGEVEPPLPEKYDIFIK